MATNASNNGPCDPRNSTSASVLLTACYCIITLAVLIGNSLIIVVVLKNRSTRKTVNWFLLNIAVSNLLIPFVFTAPEVGTFLTQSMVWHLDGLAGSISCKLTSFLADVAVSVSTFSVVLISFERFVAVVFPMRASTIGKKYRSWLILFSWLLAAALASPYLYTFEIHYHGSYTYCIHDWQPEMTRRHHIAVIVIVVITPFYLLCLFYSSILISIRRTSMAGQLNQAQRDQRARENSRVTRTALAIVFAFAICYGPTFVSNFIGVFLGNEVKIDFNNCKTVVLFTVANVLLCLYGALNPLICFVFLEAYRRTLRRLFCSSAPTKHHQGRPRGTEAVNVETNV